MSEHKLMYHYLINTAVLPPPLLQPTIYSFTFATIWNMYSLNPRAIISASTAGTWGANLGLSFLCVIPIDLSTLWNVSLLGDTPSVFIAFK